MSLFDYLVIAFGLLFTGTAIRLIGGIGSALHPRRRYWIHALLNLALLLGVAVSFWNFWGLRQVDWTLPKFLLVLLIPGFLYYCASVLIPENPNDVTSWREYYFSVHVRFFTGFACWTLVVIATSFLILDIPLNHPVRIGHIAGIILSVLGAVSSKPNVHAGVVIALTIVTVGMALSIASQPGWLIE